MPVSAEKPPSRSPGTHPRQRLIFFSIQHRMLLGFPLLRDLRRMNQQSSCRNTAACAGSYGERDCLVSFRALRPPKPDPLVDHVELDNAISLRVANYPDRILPFANHLYLLFDELA